MTQPQAQPPPLAMSGKRRPRRWLGFIKFDWKLNVSAMAALALAVWSLTLQAWGHWHGAVLTIQPAERMYVFIHGDEVLLGARMVYTNDGAERYNALVLSETVDMRIGSRSYRQWAEERGRFAESPKQQQSWELLDRKDAVPFVVPGLQLITHDAFFAPRERAPPEPWRDFIDAAPFVESLQQAQRQGQQTIDFHFSVRSRQIAGFDAGEEQVLHTRCTISLDRDFIGSLQQDRWVSRTCREALKDQ